MRFIGRPRKEIGVSDETLYQWYTVDKMSYTELSKRLEDMGYKLHKTALFARIREYELTTLQTRVSELETKLARTEQLLEQHVSK